MIWGDAGQSTILETVNTAAVPVVTRPPPTRPTLFFSPLTVVSAGAALKVAETLLRNPTLSRRLAILGRWGWTGGSTEE